VLKDTQVPLEQIAAALGYSEASAFTRAFRRWSGETPSAWRSDRRPDFNSALQQSGGSPEEVPGAHAP
jgi:AraC-like DNA-binding protein